MRPARSLLLVVAAALAASAGCAPGAKLGKMRVAPAGQPAAAGILANNAARLTGKVKLPTSIISDNGGGIISDNGGGIVGSNSSRVRILSSANRLNLSAAGESPVAGARVRLLDGAGRPILGPAGKALETTTDAAGGYAFAEAPAGRNLVVAVTLGGTPARAIAARDRADGTPVDVDLAAALTAGHVLATYVQGAADPQATLDKLPASVAADTRAAAAAALGKRPDAAPPRLDDDQVARSVGLLASRDAAFADQLAAVRRIFVTAGNVDQGAGRPALELNMDFMDAVAHGPGGELIFPSDLTTRLWRLGADGRVHTFVGRGKRDEGSLEGKPGAKAGLGQLQTFKIDAAGRTWLLEFDRLTRLAADGTLHDMWLGFTEGQAVEPLPDGGAWVLLGGGGPALWRVHPDGRREQVRPLTGLAAERVRHTAQSGLGPDGKIWLAGYHEKIVLDEDELGKVPWVGTLDPATGAFADVDVSAPDLIGASLDPRGNVFLLYGPTRDYGPPPTALKVRKPDGTVTTLATELGRYWGLGCDAALLEPDGTAIVASMGWELWRIEGGKPTKLAGLHEGTGEASDRVAFASPAGIAVRRDGTTIYADDSFASLYLQPPGGPVAVWLKGCFEEGACGGDGPVAGATLGLFVGMGLDDQDRLYMIDQDDLAAEGEPSRLRRIDGAGTVTTLYTWPLDTTIEAMATRPTGEVVAVARVAGRDGVEKRRLLRVPPGGRTPLVIVDEVPATRPCGVAVGPNDAVWVASAGRLWRFGTGVGAAGATVSEDPRIKGTTVAVDARGRPHVDGQDFVLRVDPVTGAATVVAGPGGAVLAGDDIDESIGEPRALYFDRQGNLHIPDLLTNQFKVVPADLLPP